MSEDLQLQEVVGNNLFTLRNRAGLTQEQMAEHVGVTTSTYSMMERGINGGVLSRLREFSSLFDVTIQELCTPEAFGRLEQRMRRQTVTSTNLSDDERNMIHAMRDRDLRKVLRLVGKSFTGDE